MKELERKRTVEKIKEDIESLQILEKHRKKQEELEKDPIIAQYYDLLSEIKRLEQKTKLFTSLDQTIFWEFTWANINGKDDCSHEIWIYEGSYYCLTDPWGEHDHYCKCDDESHTDFEYNIYVCLSCEKFAKVNDWQSFEGTHTVLKSRALDKNPHYYTKMFYQLLYTHSVEEAQRKLIEAFNQDKGHTKKYRPKNSF